MPPHEPADENSPPGLDQERVFEVLSNERRRYAIQCLWAEHRTDLERLVDFVTEAEFGGSVGECSDSERKSVYVSLRQHHLPVLEELGLVRFDAENGVVEPTEQTQTLQPFLTESEASSTEATQDHGSRADGGSQVAGASTGDTDRSRVIGYYAILCVASWGVALVDELGLVPYEFITRGEWAVVFLLLFTVLIFLQLWVEDESPSWWSHVRDRLPSVAVVGAFPLL